MTERTRSAARAGLVVGLSYALVETACAVLLPRLYLPGHAYHPPHPGMTLLLFGLYPLLGVGVALSLGAAFRRGAVFVERVTTLVLLVGFAVHLALHAAPTVPAGLPLWAAWTAMLLAAALSEMWNRRLCFAVNPLTTAAVLVLVPWLIVEFPVAASPGVKALEIAINLAGLLVISLAVRFVARRSGSGLRGALPWLVAASVAVVALGFLLRQQVIVRDDVVSVAPAPAGVERPNVLLISLDTVRADHLSLYGYARETTPELAEFARGATTFARAASTADQTLSSHASVFTGLYARGHGAHFGELDASPRPAAGYPLPAGLTTLAEILAAAGYETVGITANYAFLGHDFELDRGFRIWDARRPVPFLGKPAAYLLRRGVRELLTRFSSPASFDLKTRRADTINREAFRRLGELAGSGRPFLLFLNYMDAHEPYIPPPPFDTRWPGKDPSFTLDDFHALNGGVNGRTREASAEELEHLVSQYDGGIAYIDDRLGALFERLDALELTERTLVVVFSDHGQLFGEHGLFGHGVSVHQGLVHVPLVIRFPGAASGTVVEQPVSLVDVLPTVLDVVGLPSPGGLHGIGLRNLALPRPGPVVAESYPGPRAWALHERFHRVERALFHDELKLIRGKDAAAALYDLRDDPRETRNLFGAHPAAAEMTRRLEAWLAAVAPATAEAPTMSPETLERLRSLGYVQ